MAPSPTWYQRQISWHNKWHRKLEQQLVQECNLITGCAVKLEAIIRNVLNTELGAAKVWTNVEYVHSQYRPGLSNKLTRLKR